MVPLTVGVRQVSNDLIADLGALRARLARLGYPRSVEAIDTATKEFGFEFAERRALTDYGPKIACELSRVHARYRRSKE